MELQLSMEQVAVRRLAAEITNGTTADVALLFARTGGPGSRGITVFLVPTDARGLSRREIHGKLGLRGQATGELALDAVRVPDTARLGAASAGLRLALSTPGRPARGDRLGDRLPRQ
ncbi:acyl-CoA dehydrogenase family protein [Micromonospora sp. NPDC050397]|uniref:acyl-CoA dehydrogenase family protein n=1 Tax=Micromonospora sp. NPDC050397 TaxID=3364279 RepID=UPI00384E9593